MNRQKLDLKDNEAHYTHACGDESLVDLLNDQETVLYPRMWG